MRLLVTGSSGQIGSYVVDAARAADHDVLGADLRASRWTTLRGDLREPAFSLRAAKGRDAIVHLAAHVSVPESLEDPAEDARHNVIGTVQLLDAARRARVRRFVFVSSAAVYGAPTKVPIDEAHPTLPLSPYGVSKLAGEHYARIARDLWGLSTVVARPFNVYSPRQDPSSPYSGVLSRFAQRVRAGKPPVIFGDGSQTRDFIHAKDVAGFLLRLCDEDGDPPSPVNLGTGIETSIRGLAQWFVEASRLRAEPAFEAARPGEIQRSVADLGRQRSLGLVPAHEIRTSIAELLAETGPRPRRRAAEAGKEGRSRRKA